MGGSLWFLISGNSRDDTIGAMGTITMIRTDGELRECIDAIRRSGWVAMDTEFVRERTYAPMLCLIQVANAGFSACIDPLAVDDLSPLGELLGDSEVTKIFHSCRQDLEALDTRMAVRAGNLYDTQLAAAFCGYGDQVSYAALVASVCAVHLPKAHTRADWSRRPLPHAQLQYALDDVAYLHPLHQALDRLLAQKGRVEWHRAECDAAVAPANYRFDPDDAWLRLKGVGRLDAAGWACARELAVWRERRAQARNLPRGWILPTPVLLEICRRRPDTLEKLAGIAEISPRTVKRLGGKIIAVVRKNSQDAGAETEGSCPPPILTPEQRGRVKKIMNLLERRAQQAEISRSLFANRQEIESFVRGKIDLPLFTGWRAQLAGDEIRQRYRYG